METKESFSIKGINVMAEIKRLIAEGNVTKIVITQKSGKEIINMPITIGIIGVVILPILAAVATVAALLTECTITVTRNGKKTNTNEIIAIDQHQKEV